MREESREDVDGGRAEQVIIDGQEGYYRDLVEHSRDLICTHDLEGRILFVNSAAVKISGYDLAILRTESGGDSTVTPEFVITGVIFHPS